MASSDAVRSRLRRLEERIDRHWLPLLVATVAVVLAAATVGRHLLTPLAVSRDSALFQHAGWYVLRGATPYVDFFDVKPPLIYAVTTVLAALSGGNMAVLHLLSVAVAAAAVGSGVVAVGVLTHRVTGDGTAAYAAGVSLFVFPTVYAFPSLGIRPKYLAFCFGVGALVWAVDDRPAASGAAAAASAGFWQLGALVAALVVAVGYRRGGRRGTGLTVAGGVAVAAAVVAPFVAAGLTVPLVVETIIAPGLRGRAVHPRGTVPRGRRRGRSRRGRAGRRRCLRLAAGPRPGDGAVLVGRRRRRRVRAAVPS
jgi:hypothetical protein